MLQNVTHKWVDFINEKYEKWCFVEWSSERSWGWEKEMKLIKSIWERFAAKTEGKNKIHHFIREMKKSL